MLHVPQHVAHVDLDVAGVGRIEVPVRDDRVQGAVEGQADQFAALVQCCRTRVAAGDVERGQVVHGHGLQGWVDILAEVLGFDRCQLGGWGVELAFAGVLGDDALDGGERGPGAGAVGAVIAAGDLAEGHAQGCRWRPDTQPGPCCSCRRSLPSCSPSTTSGSCRRVLRIWLRPSGRLHTWRLLP